MLLIRAANLLGKPFGVNPFPRAFDNPALSGTRTRDEAFETIFQENGWGSNESVSGAGSDAGYARPYARRLRRMLAALPDVRRVFDAPCGDLNWILPAVKGFAYEGGDIAPSLIARLQRDHPELALRTFDICRDPFPPADIWHCRDCLFHLPLADVRLALENFARSEISYALLTTHKARLHHRNLDVPVGGFRYLDLERAPFSLPRPLHEIRDYRRGRDFPRYVGVWTREQVRAALAD